MAATCCKTLDPNVLNTIPCVFSNFTVLIHPHMQPNDQYLIVIIPKLLHSLFLCVSVCVVCSLSCFLSGIIMCVSYQIAKV